MINYTQMLREFHEKYGHYIGNNPSNRVISLRYKLIDEEVNKELLDELDKTSYQNIETVRIADALADSLYVIFGTALSFGIPIDEVFAEVHRSNMTKSLDKDNNGKSIKGENYEPPNLEPILFPTTSKA